MSKSSECVALGEFVVDRPRRRLLRNDGAQLDLTPRQFDALLLFVEHAGDVLEKDHLIAALWPGLVVEENNLSQLVSRLRRALGDDAQGSRFIQTVPRRGFRLIAAVTPLPTTPEHLDETGSALTQADPDAVGRHAKASVQGATPDGSFPVRGQAASAAPPTHSPPRRRLMRWAAACAAAAGLAGAGAWLVRRRDTTGPPTLAVLPFKPLSPDSRDSLLEVGMADSLIARLSSVPGLVVRSIGSVKRYAGSEQDARKAGTELEVTWILDGSLQRQGDQLRVTARLLRATDGTAVWSGSFDERFTGVFALQDQISSRVVQALAAPLHLGATALKPVTDAGGTHSADAYQLYLAASRRAEGGRGDGLREAIALFRQALAVDPGYANALVGLAWASRRQVWNADAVPRDAFRQSSEALAQALQLVPGLLQARAGVATTLYIFDFDWAAAERELRSVLAVSQNVANAHWDLASLLLTQGHLEEGFQHLRRARESDPASAVLNTIEASFLVDLGELAEARLRLDRAFAFAPNLWLAHVAQGLLLFAEQRADLGLASMRRAVTLADGTSRAKGVLASHLARTGQVAEARAILGELQALAQTRFVPPTTLAMVHAALGENRAALDALQRAVAVRDTRLIYLRNDASWRSLRSDARFRALLKDLSLDKSGSGLTPV